MDYARAAFVQQDYRYKIAEDLGVRAAYGNSRELVIDTQLSASDANTLATALLAALKSQSREFEVELGTILTTDDFAGSVPRFSCTFDKYGVSGVTFRVVGAQIDYLNQRTTVTLRS
jgi:hypothetical protein